MSEVDARLEQILQRDAAQSSLPGFRSLPLAELEALARSLLSAFLALLDARVARQEAGLLQPLPQLDVVSTSARAMPSRSAPAWPAMPPPAIVASTSNLSAVSVTAAAA